MTCSLTVDVESFIGMSSSGLGVVPPFASKQDARGRHLGEALPHDMGLGPWFGLLHMQFGSELTI
jgi:hypothetical protein